MAMDLFKSKKRSVIRLSSKFQTKTIDYTFVTKQNDEVEQDSTHGQMWIHRIFQSAIEHIWNQEEIGSSDKISIQITGGDLTYPLIMPYHAFHSATHQYNALMDHVGRVQQSKREWMLGSSITLVVTIVQSPRGNGRKMTGDRLTKARYQELIELKNFCPGSLVNILKFHLRVRGQDSHEPDDHGDDDDDEDVYRRLTQWCNRHTDVNVLLLHQPQGWDTPIGVKWKSVCKDPQNVLVLWRCEQTRRLFHVRRVQNLFESRYRIALCVQCGGTYAKYRTHRCGEEESVVRSSLKHKAHFKCVENETRRKRSCYSPSQDDSNCLGTCILTALQEWGIEDSTKSLKDWYAEMKMEEWWNETSTLETVKRWANQMDQTYCHPDGTPRFQLVIYDQSLRNVIARYGAGQRHVFLNVGNHHYMWIRSMPSWVGSSYFCTSCMKGYNTKEHHRCVRGCTKCGHSTELHSNTSRHQRECTACGILFQSSRCFDYHLEIRTHKQLTFKQCERRFKCPICLCTVDLLVGKKLMPRSSHQCYVYNCTICGKKEVMRGEHKCYIAGAGQVKSNENDYDPEGRLMNLAFFDFETRCLEEHHVVNKVVVLLVCDQCKDHVEEYRTRGCLGLCGRQRLWTFDTIGAFMDWLLGPHLETWTEYTFLAHNLKGYDSYPLLEECVKRNIRPSSCVYQGSKVITMTIAGITFKDSLCFIPMALRHFPATFGTSGGKKGFFPHFFNKIENANYVGPYPDAEMYGYEDMADKERDELTQWLSEQQGKIMHFQQELTEYCIQDVLVMMRGCLKYRELYVSLFGVDPFVEATTLASTCLRVFTKNFLPSDTLGIVPPMGYRPSDVYSAQALEWLYSLQRSNIQCALSATGEAHVMGAKVDGYEPDTKTVYQYHGCFWHGCDVCFRNRYTVNPVLGCTMQELREKTQFRSDSLRRAGYRVVEMWSHQWCEEREQHGTFPRNVTRFAPLDPRQALTGGRTNAIGLYAYTDEVEMEQDDETDCLLQSRVQPAYRIRYIDVVSLYPTVMKQERFPIGHPEIMTYPNLPSVEECTRHIQEDVWFGILKVDVDPPRGLFFPVLPTIVNHRLMFGLCRTCMSLSCESTLCEHDAEARRLLDGVWTTFEIKKALEKGYTIHTVHEVWHYPQTSDDLFTEYIDKNLKMKLEASGWPTWCRSEEEKRQFVNEVFQRESIVLDPDNMSYNPGMRGVAKFNLNSLWGKFAQNEFHSKTEYVTEPEDYYKLIYSDTLEVQQIILLNDGQMAQVTYSELKESVKPLAYGNVVLASCVTSHARLRLYDMLDRLQERVLYHDTDSVIYQTMNQDDAEIPTGSSLGQWEDECKDPSSDWLIEFVSIGPKSYAYRTHAGKEVVKCKGITMDMSTKKKIHIQRMKEMVMHQSECEEITYPRRITRDKVLKHLRTEPVTKCVQLVYTKRQRRADSVETLPYGY